VSGDALLLRSQTSGGLWSEDSLGKKLVRTPPGVPRLGVMVWTCYPSYRGGIGKRFEV
jgi:hypothetical protein